MGGIQFNEQGPRISRRARRKQPTLIRWVLKTGIVNRRRDAEYVLIGIAIVAIVISIFLFMGAAGDDVAKKYEYDPRTDTVDDVRRNRN